jgi:hypothetical protein
MPLLSTLFGRTADVDYVRECATAHMCCSLVGVSNVGKSALLRALCNPVKQSANTPTFVYVDCNEMPERTARAFFIAIWHALLLRLQPAAVRAEAEHLYDEIIHAPDKLSASLHFEQAFTFALDHLNPLVLCFDEFDEAYQNLEPQTFLNLRSLHDRYNDALTYVTATGRELARLTTTREQGEFYELIVPRVRFMRFMASEDTRRFCQAFAEREHVTFSEDDLSFIARQSDGHPGLVQAVCYVLGPVTGERVRNKHQDRVIHEHVQPNLGADPNVQTECAKIWADLEPDERDALLSLHHVPSSPTPVEEAARRGLESKSIVRASEEGPQVFSRLFDDFVRQQNIVIRPDKRGVYIDVDAGDVWVDGQAIQALTDLEYRLLLFLYGRLDRVCDKYAIVEAVWGQDYIDKVDDTRIEKLISRLRQKIEPDPTHPRFLHSLRGRGYKLVR